MWILLMGPVLGIESSCDETATALLAADGRILAEAVLSQERDAVRQRVERMLQQMDELL